MMVVMMTMVMMTMPMPVPMPMKMTMMTMEGYVDLDEWHERDEMSLVMIRIVTILVCDFRH